jgi:hypothetical protein
MNRSCATPARRRATVTSISASEIAARLGPAEAQYAETLTLGLVGNQGPLACGVTIVDQDANDLSPTDGGIRVDLAWNDLSAETGYRLQVDDHSATFVSEDSGYEIAADLTSAFTDRAILPNTTYTVTFRLLGHVGHAPAHGATPIAGDVVSNECSVTFQKPPDAPPA